MSFISYNLNIPFQSNKPSVDQPNMLTNTNAIAAWVLVDHFGFNDNQGGWHKNIHQPPQGTPGTVAGINQLYAQNVSPNTTGGTPDTQLFTKTGAGGISQITGNSAMNEGYQWLGGVIIQWGFVGPAGVTTGSFASGFATGTVTFKDRAVGAIGFKTNLFSVSTTLQYTAALPGGAGSVSIDTTPASTNFNKFTWRFNSNSAQYTGFMWMAIGV